MGGGIDCNDNNEVSICDCNFSNRDADVAEVDVVDGVGDALRSEGAPVALPPMSSDRPLEDAIERQKQDDGGVSCLKKGAPDTHSTMIRETDTPSRVSTSASGTPARRPPRESQEDVGWVKSVLLLITAVPLQDLRDSNGWV